MNTTINLGQLKAYAIPIFAFLFVVAATLTIGLSQIERIGAIRAELEAENVKKTSLSVKRDFLSNLNENTLRSEAQAALAAFPDQDSLLVLISTVRSVSLSRGLSISGFSVKYSDKDTGINEINVTISLQGNIEAILSFADEIKKYSPLMVVAGENITSSSGFTTANIELISSWQALPKNIGQVNTPLEALKGTDGELLKNITNLKKVATFVESSSPSGRENPFQL